MGARGFAVRAGFVRPKSGETIMEMTNLVTNGQREAVTICPCCGGSDYEDNRISERLYALAAQEAPRLRFEGNTDEAVELLSALYAIRIANFIRPEWRCNACGVTFDG